MAKSVKVHDDTHRALKKMKAKSRSASIDQVIRELIRDTTGTPPEEMKESAESDNLSRYFDG